MRPRAVLTLLLLLISKLISGQQLPVVPRADYHQHLLSPTGAELINKPLPAVVLPRALAKVLEKHSAHWNDKTGLASLYSPHVLAFSNLQAEVIRGADKTADFMSRGFRAGYRMTPIAFNVSAAAAHIIGYLERGDGKAAKPFGYFDLALTRIGSNWLIGSEMLVFPGPKQEEPQFARELVAALDDAGIAKAVVLSDAYFFDSPLLRANGGSYEQVRAENDWTAAQVAQYPDRLVALCSFNPLASYAIAELDRCAASGKFRGLKLHFGTSGVDLDNPAHVEKVRAVVAEANRLKMPLLVHVRTNAQWPGRQYGSKEAQILIDRIVVAAPDVAFTIAHLWGGEAYSAEALKTYADRVHARDPNTKNLYFDLAEVDLVLADSPDLAKEAAERMREIGMDRMLYGSDGPIAESQTPRDGWARTLKVLPLTDHEFRTIANNVAPYFR